MVLAGLGEADEDGGGPSSPVAAREPSLKNILTAEKETDKIVFTGRLLTLQIRQLANARDILLPRLMNREVAV